MLMWSIPWGLVGAAIGTVIRVTGVFEIFSRSPDWPLPLLFGVLGAVVGAVNGLVFAVLLMLSERNRRISELRVLRVGGLAALASAATIYIVFRQPIFAAIGAVLGFAGGALSLRLAARPESRAVPTKAGKPEG